MAKALKGKKTPSDEQVCREQSADLACTEYMKLDLEYNQLLDRLRLLERVLIPAARKKFSQAKLEHLQGKW